ncbi:hypothetical protein F5148DRAFT_1266636 [Russula earlei]|uniref:Uncharacterized protein n=1 Tax=Russula earlei TaxID=71964 RepID=A0ACC0TSP1_9AGAM|nr:hypothetical protein F5148DRAFT_1266636 [Russula earlei]
MPRNRRRVVDTVSDHIDDDDATQPQSRDVDPVDAEGEEEDEQPRPPKRRNLSRFGQGQAESSKMAKARDAMEAERSDDGAGERDATPAFDGDELGNKPLSRHDAPRLQGMASDWNMIESHLKENAFSLLTEVSAAVAEHADEGTADEELERLDSLMRDLIDIDVEIRSHEHILRDLHPTACRWRRDRELFFAPVSLTCPPDVLCELQVNVLDTYQTQTQEKLDEYKKRTSRQKYAKSEAYAAFRQSIYEVQHPNEAMPPVVEFLPQEEGDNSDDDDDDDIQVGGVLQDLNCPITLTPLVDPQTSTVCQHSFSAAAIRQVLGPNRFTKKKCPASGCNQMICLNDLKPNKDLARRVNAQQRRAQRREEEHDAEEVVE